MGTFLQFLYLTSSHVVLNRQQEGLEVHLSEFKEEETSEKEETDRTLKVFSDTIVAFLLGTSWVNGAHVHELEKSETSQDRMKSDIFLPEMPNKLCAMYSQNSLLSFQAIIDFALPLFSLEILQFKTWETSSGDRKEHVVRCKKILDRSFYQCFSLHESDIKSDQWKKSCRQLETNEPSTAMSCPE